MSKRKRTERTDSDYVYGTDWSIKEHNVQSADEESPESCKKLTSGHTVKKRLKGRLKPPPEYAKCNYVEDWSEIQTFEQLESSVLRFIPSRLDVYTSPTTSAARYAFTGKDLIHYISPPINMPVKILVDLMRLGHYATNRPGGQNVAELKRLCDLALPKRPKNNYHINFFSKVHPDDVKGMGESLRDMAFASDPEAPRLQGEAKDLANTVKAATSLLDSAVQSLSASTFNSFTNGGMHLINAARDIFVEIFDRSLEVVHIDNGTQDSTTGSMAGKVYNTALEECKHNTEKHCVSALDKVTCSIGLAKTKNECDPLNSLPVPKINDNAYKSSSVASSKILDISTITSAESIKKSVPVIMNTGPLHSAPLLPSSMDCTGNATGVQSNTQRVEKVHVISGEEHTISAYLECASSRKDVHQKRKNTKVLESNDIYKEAVTSNAYQLENNQPHAFILKGLTHGAEIAVNSQGGLQNSGSCQNTVQYGEKSIPLLEASQLTSVVHTTQNPSYNLSALHITENNAHAVQDNVKTPCEPCDPVNSEVITSTVNSATLEPITMDLVQTVQAQHTTTSTAADMMFDNIDRS